MLKMVGLFLVVIVAVSVLGRVRLGGLLPKPPGAQTKPGKCAKCGRFQIGKGPCECGAPHA